MKNPFRPIAISLIPNFRIHEVLLSGRLLLCPWRYRDKEGESELCQKLAKYLGRKRVVLFESGRSAQYFLLRALGIGAGDEVIIQAFTCVAVPNSVIWTGAVPIFVDIDGTYNLNVQKLERAITARTKAVIVQHTFGKPADIAKIREICDRHEILLLEDCAHGLGNIYRGKKLGTLGKAAFFSFGRDKVISGVLGGAVATDDAGLALRLTNLADELPQWRFWDFIKCLKYPIWIYIVLETYNLFSIGRVLHFLLRRARLLPEILTRGERETQKPKFFYRGMGVMAQFVLSQLLELPELVYHRRRIAQFYATELKLSYNPSSSYLRYCLQVEDPGGLRRFAAKERIFLGDWYDSVVAPKGVNLEKVGYKSGSCPQAEAICRSVINLPTNPNIGLEEAAKVVGVVKLWRSQK